MQIFHTGIQILIKLFFFFYLTSIRTKVITTLVYEDEKKKYYLKNHHHEALIWTQVTDQKIIKTNKKKVKKLLNSLHHTDTV